jgi:Uma2 family endonuclease
MIRAIEKPISFDEFIDWYPENSQVRYELRRGVIIEMPKPRGKHSDVAGFITIEAGILIRQLKAEYFIPKECIVRVDEESAYEPDGIILDRREILNEPNWEKSSVIENGTTIKLIIEVVSTNWRDDYYVKFAAYEALGIREYWIVDYAALGGRRFLGNPKQPTLSVCELIDGEYQITQFRGSDRIISPTFPDLQLTAEQIFQVSTI